MAWQGIEGHDAVVRAFVAAAARGRVAGAYLFVGPPGVGKSSFARRLAQALACPACGPELVPCGRCASCAQAEAGSHPDIEIVAKPEDRATIPLDALIGDAAHRMREGLCWRMLLRPALAARKVAIILDADALSVEGANCLLKLLEEPPEGAVFILVGTALERQLPTIRSRCQIVRFSALDAATVRRVLAAEPLPTADPADEAALAAAAAASGGSLARARLLLDADLAAFRGRLVGLLAGRPLRGVELARETLAVVEAAGKEAPQRRARLRMVLETALDCFRDSLRRAAASGDASATEEVVVRMQVTLDTLAAIDRNANLSVLVDAWTALLEEPRLRAAI
jgi:DNA polymerase-3 subunit delta'